MNKTYLVHHGIKGQRWGVRRYQNENGTLTSDGKKRYGNPREHGNSIDNKEGKKILESDYRRADAEASKAVLEGTSKSLNSAGDIVDNIGKHKSKAINKADYSKMSDQELRDRINRINMERKYGELTGDTKLVRSGQDWTREILQTTGAIAGIGASIAGTIWTIRKIKLEQGRKGVT
jgi:hypothetical protein